MPRKLKHVHKYRWTDIRFAKVWSCALPNCNHYMPQHLENLMEGKTSLCFDCNKEFLLDKPRMEYAINENEGRVICFACQLKKLDIKENELDVLL